MDGKTICEYLDSMPQCKKDALAEATLDFINRLLAQPGGRERIEKRKAQLRAEGRL